MEATSSAMRDLDIVRLQNMKDHIVELQKGLRNVPETLEGLKEVLNVINTIRTTGVERKGSRMMVSYKMNCSEYKTTQYFTLFPSKFTFMRFSMH